MNSYYAAVLDGENIVGIVLKDLRTNALRQYSIDETVQLAKSNEIMLMGVDEYGKLSVLKNESDIKEGASAAGGIIYDKDIEKFFRLNPRVHAEDIEWLRGGYGRIVMCPVYAKKSSGIRSRIFWPATMFLRECLVRKNGENLKDSRYSLLRCWDTILLLC